MEEFENLNSLTLADFSAQLGTAAPTPGGGAANGVAAMMAAALVRMVAGVTAGRRRYQSSWELAESSRDRALTLSEELLEAADEDAAVYRQVVLVLQHHSHRNNALAVRAIEDALIAAAQVPLKIARLATEAGRLARQMALHGNLYAAADAAVACFLAEAAVRGSLLNIKANLKDIDDVKLRRRYVNEATRLAREMKEIVAETLPAVEKRLFSEEDGAGRDRNRGRRSRSEGND